MEITKEAIGHRIRETRLKQGLAQIALAGKLGIVNKKLSSYENGVVFAPLPVLAELAKVFGTTLDWLITGAEPASATVTREEALREALKQALSGDDHLAREAQGGYHPTSEKERRLLVAFRQLDERRQGRLIEDAEEGVFVLQQSRRKGNQGGSLPESNCA